MQVDFLLHLEEFDRRRAYLEAGFGSLWDYLTRCLHYREGATHRRIRAMRVLRRLPQLAEELDQLTELLSHKVPSGDLSAVLRQAVQCALERHGKRRGAMEPTRKRKVTPSPSAAKSTAIQGRQPIPAEVRRQVWKRDEGCCAWTGPDGRRCGSKWKLELDHIHAAALGGPSTVENLRLACTAHNRLHAEQTFAPRTWRASAERRPNRVNLLPPEKVELTAHKDERRRAARRTGIGRR